MAINILRNEENPRIALPRRQVPIGIGRAPATSNGGLRRHASVFGAGAIGRGSAARLRIPVWRRLTATAANYRAVAFTRFGLPRGCSPFLASGPCSMRWSWSRFSFKATL